MASTPGPWRAEQYEDSHESAIIGGLYQIATVYYDTNESDNARLIAAAPDLLAACQAILPDLKDSSGDAEYWQRVQAVRDAVAKATK